MKTMSFSPESWYAHRGKILVISALFFLFVFGYYYPSYFTSGDEHSYLTGAALLANGNLVQESNAYYCALSKTPAGYISTYPIGKSILLLPFLAGGIDFIFWSGALVHVLNFILFIFILRRLKANELWSLLYLFFPAFQWSTRTLFPELSVLTFFLAAYYMWLDSRTHAPFFTGALLGAALFFRTDAFLGMMAFSTQAFFRERKRLLPLLVGFAVPLFTLFAFNLSTYHALLPQVATASNILGRTFGISLVIEFITFLAILALLAPPLSIFAIRREEKHFILFAALILFTSIFFVRFYSFWSLGITIPHILTVRLRYFIPAIGLLMIPAVHYYSYAWSKHIYPFIFSRAPLFTPRVVSGLTILTLLCAGAGTIYLHQTHESLLDSRKLARDAIHDTIPENAVVIGSADDCIYFLPPFTGMKTYYPAASLPENFTIHSNTYLVDISYSTQRDTGTGRQDVIDAERKKIKDLILENESSLEKMVSIRNGTYVDIWRGKP